MPRNKKVEGAQKMVKMYDGLMKSGKFTAAQNKAKEEEHLDSISELVAMCEKEGFIPRFYIDSPNDKVDETLFDLKSYTKSLVMEELNLGNLIENAVKAMSEEESKEEDEDTDEVEEDIGGLLTYPGDEELDIEDYNDFNDFIESQSDEGKEV